MKQRKLCPREDTDFFHRRVLHSLAMGRSIKSFLYPQSMKVEVAMFFRKPSCARKISNVLKLSVFAAAIVAGSVSWGMTDNEVRNAYKNCLVFLNMSPRQKVVVASRTTRTAGQMAAACRSVTTRGVAQSIRDEHDYLRRLGQNQSQNQSQSQNRRQSQSSSDSNTGYGSRGCSSSRECNWDDHCRNGQCESKGSFHCSGDIECSAGDHCVNEVCQ